MSQSHKRPLILLSKLFLILLVHRLSWKIQKQQVQSCPRDGTELWGP